MVNYEFEINEAKVNLESLHFERQLFVEGKMEDGMFSRVFV